MNLVLRIAAIILTMLFSLVYITTRTIAPDYNFEYATTQVGSDVEVVFDDMAVPHIYADSEPDAMYDDSKAVFIQSRMGSVFK